MYVISSISWVQYRKIFPNVVDNNWLWWIMSGILANQKRQNILNEYCNENFYYIYG